MLTRRVLDRMSAIMGPFELDIVEVAGKTGEFELGMLVGFGATPVLCDLNVRAVNRERQRMDEVDVCSCDENPREQILCR